jgi:hypothetical protein
MIVSASLVHLVMRRIVWWNSCHVMTTMFPSQLLPDFYSPSVFAPFFVLPPLLVPFKQRVVGYPKPREKSIELETMLFIGTSQKLYVRTKMSVMKHIFAPLLLRRKEPPMHKQHCRSLIDTMKSF